MAQRMPNVILIVLDAARADHLSCYGYHRPTTPNIDQLAAEGVLYQNAISPAIWTIPSHASIFTGLYPSEHGTYFRRFRLPSQHRTLAQEMQELGYQTIGLTGNGLVGRASGLNRGFAQYREMRELFPGDDLPLWRYVANKFYMRFLWKRRDYGASRITRLAKRYLKQHDPTRPFFLFINYLETHLEFRPPAKLAKAFLPSGVSLRDVQTVNQNAWKYLAGQVEMTDRDFAILRSLYDAELRYVDMHLGQVLDLMRSLNMLDDTIFIVTSDHGENLGEHAMMDHQYCLYDTLLRVPLVIRYPTELPAGVRISHQVQTLDLPISILRWSQAQRFEVVSRSFAGHPLPVGPADPVRRFAVAEYLHPQLHPFTRRGLPVNHRRFDRRLRAIRTDTHKLIWSSNHEHELYDLWSDPGEEHNVFLANREKARHLRTLLEDWEVEHGVDQGFSIETDRQEDIDPVVEQRLRDLGYI